MKSSSVNSANVYFSVYSNLESSLKPIFKNWWLSLPNLPVDSTTARRKFFHSLRCG